MKVKRFFIVRVEVSVMLSTFTMMPYMKVSLEIAVSKLSLIQY